MFTLICARMKGWVNNREAGDLRRYRVPYGVIVMVRSRAARLVGPTLNFRIALKFDRCLGSCVLEQFWIRILWLRDFPWSYNKTSYPSCRISKQAQSDFTGIENLYLPQCQWNYPGKYEKINWKLSLYEHVWITKRNKVIQNCGFICYNVVCIVICYHKGTCLKTPSWVGFSKGVK